MNDGYGYQDLRPISEGRKLAINKVLARYWKNKDYEALRYLACCMPSSMYTYVRWADNKNYGMLPIGIF